MFADVVKRFRSDDIGSKERKIFVIVKVNQLESNMARNKYILISVNLLII